jgi:hypothetical protein
MSAQNAHFRSLAVTIRAEHGMRARGPRLIIDRGLRHINPPLPDAP